MDDIVSIQSLTEISEKDAKEINLQSLNFFEGDKNINILKRPYKKVEDKIFRFKGKEEEEEEKEANIFENENRNSYIRQQKIMTLNNLNLAKSNCEPCSLCRIF